jgi:hypothetical protein
MEFYLRNKIRPLFAFLLVTAFLVLSYCPLRRAIQDVLGGSTRTSKWKQTAAVGRFMPGNFRSYRD